MSWPSAKTEKLLWAYEMFTRCFSFGIIIFDSLSSCCEMTINTTSSTPLNDDWWLIQFHFVAEQLSEHKEKAAVTTTCSSTSLFKEKQKPFLQLIPTISIDEDVGTRDDSYRTWVRRPTLHSVASSCISENSSMYFTTVYFKFSLTDKRLLTLCYKLQDDIFNR